MSDQLLHAITIPLFTGAIGYVTNWSGVWMLFYPLRFHGFRVPGLGAIAHHLPRRIQQIPGLMQGGIGWQGIVPSRAAKMGSIAVDKGIAKLGQPADFYRQLEPDAIAEHILSSAGDEVRAVVERIMEREYPRLWRELPPRVREMIHSRVADQLPEVVYSLTEQLGEHADQLLDIKLMVIRRIDEQPQLANRIFLEVGRKELKFIVNFGFWFGLAMGVPVVGIVALFPIWWVLPICGVVIGYVTNWVGLWMIFEPEEPRRIGPILWQGLFPRRQREVAGVYAGIVAEDLVTLEAIGDELLNGRRGDRTRQMIETTMKGPVDRAVGRARPAVRAALGSGRYTALRDSVAEEVVDYAIAPLGDPDFNRRQSASMKRMIQERMEEMPPSDFSEMLRSAMKEDEWLLLLHGAVLGFGAGLLHLAIFGV